MSKILIIEDDRLLLDVVREWLTSEHHQVESTDNGREGLLLLDGSAFDVILLDWELPELSGVEIVKAFRARGGVTPVIMFTKRSDVEDKLSGLDTGCDDYLTKPFELKELSARIRAVLRRPHTVVNQVLKAADLELDPVTHVLKKDGVEVSLLPKEFSLLEFLMRNPDQVFNAEALITRVWSSDAAITDEAVGATIWRLRKKIDGKGQASFIRTIYGVGYRFESEPEK